MVTDTDLKHLRRCLELAAEALDAGDAPFGSVLVAADGTVLREERNRVMSTGDDTRHPEFELARWAARNLDRDQRRAATVFTSGEHCAMCAATHARVGLGRIVYATSGEQIRRWCADLGIPPSPLPSLAINEVAPNLPVAGPVPELVDRVRELVTRYFGRDAGLV